MKILMPKLGLTMTEGTVIEWLKQPGELVRMGEILFLFESEKAVMEFEAPADGVLEQVLVEAGETAPCGEPVAILRTDAEHAIAAMRPQQEPLATPAARRRARELGVDLATIPGRGPDGRVQLEDVEEAITQTQQEVSRGDRQRVSPLAQRLADDLGIVLDDVRGRGPGGRIMRDDVVAAARTMLAATQRAPSLSPPEPPPHGRYSSRTRLSGVRAVIARRMSKSAFAAPHVTLHTEADATALVAVRRQINEELAGELNIAYNSLLIALAARALQEHPGINACLVDDEIRIYANINIALAVDTVQGLLAPVIHHADTLDVAAIQQRSNVLIARALAGQSLPDDLTNGTFTITNLGGFEIDGFTPIINPPQAAILGVGRIHSRPVDVHGKVALRPMVTLSLSFDHRIIDGGPAARFLQRMKQLIERPSVVVLKK